MEIKVIDKEEIIEEIILDDIEHVNESLIELKRSILNLNDKDEDSEVYHRFCDMEDEVVNVIEEIKSILKGEKINERENEYTTKIS